MSDDKQPLQALEQENCQAAGQLLPLVYDELRRLAAQKLAREKPGQTIGATALVHEAYLRLMGPTDQPRWQGRRHFVAAAAEAMRRILVDNARRKRSVKHGGDRDRLDLEAALPSLEPKVDILALNDALDRLAAHDPVKAELVKLRFFVGLTMPEAAQVLDISLATAERYWTFSRAWLFTALGDADHADESSQKS